MKRPSWTIRRRIIFVTLIICAVVVLRFTFMATEGVDPELAKMLVMSVTALAGTTIGAYVFGATWDDMNAMKALGKEAYVEPPLPPPQEYG